MSESKVYVVFDAGGRAKKVYDSAAAAMSDCNDSETLALCGVITVFRPVEAEPKKTRRGPAFPAPTDFSASADTTMGVP